MEEIPIFRIVCYFRNGRGALWPSNTVAGGPWSLLYLRVYVALGGGGDHEVFEGERRLDDAVAELELLACLVRHVLHLDRLASRYHHLEVLPLQPPVGTRKQAN